MPLLCRLRLSARSLIEADLELGGADHAEPTVEAAFVVVIHHLAVVYLNRAGVLW